MRLRTLVPTAFLLVASLLAPLPALAAWPSDPSVNLLLSGSGFSPLDLNYRTDGAGGLLVAWVQSGAQGFDIYAQHLSATGQLLWGPNGVVVTAVVGDQTQPAIVVDGAGGAVLVWVDTRNVNPDLYAQRLNAVGTSQWTSGGVVVCNDVSVQSANGFPDLYDLPIISDGAGGAIVAWADGRAGTEDIWAQRISSTGAMLWTANGLSVCNAALDQYYPAIVSDGANGALISWTDLRAGFDIYGQHVSAAGSALWPANGLAINNSTGTQTAQRAVADGSGGEIVAWLDTRAGNTAIFAQRVAGNGSTYWAASGVSVCNAALSRGYLGMCPDDAGGAFVEWFDSRVATGDLYVQHLNAFGVAAWTTDGFALQTSGQSGSGQGPILASDGAGGVVTAWLGNFAGGTNEVVAQHVASGGYALWTVGGIPMGFGPFSRQRLGGAGDGSGGLVAAWFDQRNPIAAAYAQRVDRYGYLGSPEPQILAVRDVTGDQGSQVKVSWSASTRDVDGVFGIADYRVWRSAPSSLLAASLRTARALTTDPDAAAAGGGLLSAQGYAWELCGTQAAGPLPTYSFVAATTRDSMGAGNPRTAFMVEARAGSYVGANHWYSPADSGYSVDNLPPVIPAPFTGQYAAGTTNLHWSPNTESDLAGYRLYRGTSPGFTSDAGSLVAAVTDTGYADVAGGAYYYKLSAVDAHGNESGFATLLPSGTTGVGQSASYRLSLAPPSPNPARAGGGLIVRFTLPVEARVKLALFDAQGRQVRVLADGAYGAGETAVPLDGRDSAGARLEPGLYFVRLAVGGEQRTRRLALIE